MSLALTTPIQKVAYTQIGAAPETPDPKETLIDLIFGKVFKGFFPEEERGISGKFVNHAYVVADVSWTPRAIIDLLSPLSAMDRFIGNTSYFYQSLGITTGLNTFIGSIELKYSCNRLMQAKNKEEVFFGLMGVVQSALQVLAGAAFLAFRPLSIIGTALGEAAPSLLGRVTFGVGSAGNALWGVFYAVMAVASAAKLALGAKFDIECALYKGDRVKFLEQKLQLTEGELAELYHPKNDEKYKQRAIAEGAKMLHALAKKVKREVPDFPQNLSRRECARLIENAFAGEEETLIDVGRELKKEELLQSKTASLARVTDENFALQVKKGETKEKDLLWELKKARIRTAVLTVALLSVALLGVGATIASFVFTGGISAAVVAAVFLLVVFGMLLLDGYAMHQDFKAGRVGKYDSKMIILHMVIGVAATVTALVLTGVFSFGVIPLVAIGVTGGAWVGVNIYALIQLRRLHRKYKEEHPTHAFFLNAVRSRSGYNEQKVVEIFSKLPLEDRNAIVERLPEDVEERDEQGRVIYLNRQALRHATEEYHNELFTDERARLRRLGEFLSAQEYTQTTWV